MSEPQMRFETGEEASMYLASEYVKNLWDENERLRAQRDEDTHRIRRLEGALLHYKRPEWDAMSPDEWVAMIEKVLDGRQDDDG